MMLNLTTATLLLLGPPVVTFIGVRVLLRMQRYDTIMQMRRRRDRMNWMRAHRERLARLAWNPSVN